MAGFWLKSHDTHTFAAQGMKGCGIHANKPLISQRPEWQSSPVSAREKATRCSPAPCGGATGLEQAAGTDTAPLGCAGTEQPGDRDIPGPGAGVLRPWVQGCSGPGSRAAPSLGPGMLWPWDQGCPSLGSGVLHPWGHRCPGPGIKDAPALGSGMLHPWGHECPGPGIKDAPALRSRMLHTQGQGHPGPGMSIPGMRDALCDGEPKSGHQAHARGAGHQPTPSTSAAGLEPEPIPPRFAWEQPQTPATPSPEGHLVSPHAGHPPPSQPRRDQGKGHDGANQTKVTSPTTSSNKHTSI